MNNNNFKYISIGVIISRLLKHPLLKDMNIEDIISYTVDVLRLVNVPSSYVEKGCYLELADYKALIPEENINVKTVDYIKSGFPIPMVMATDTLHNHIDVLPKDRNSSEYTYSVNGCMIKTNCIEGVVFVTYDILAQDENGLPMIPDNVALIKAIENYVKSNVFGVFADLGKMPRASAEKAEQEYNWYIGKAQTSFQGFKNEDDIESFLRDFKRLFIINKSHDTRHRYNVNRELKYKNG